VWTVRTVWTVWTVRTVWTVWTVGIRAEWQNVLLNPRDTNLIIEIDTEEKCC